MTETDQSNIHDDPEYNLILLAVGECLAAWSNLEHLLGRLFSALVVGDPNQIATAFAAVISFETRLAMVDSIALRDSDKALKRSWVSIQKKLFKSHKKRHEVAHFTMIYHNNVKKHRLHPFHVIGKPIGKSLTASDIATRTDRFIALGARVTNLYFYVLHRQGKLGEGVLQGRDPLELLRNPDD